MTLISVYCSCRVLTDIGRRSFYLRVILLGCEAWVQWWPRSAPGSRLTVGARRGA